MWFSASTKHFVGINRFGKLEKIIDLGDRFILHHDYALDDDGNIVSLATDLTRYDHAVQDQAIKVNTSTGKVTKLNRVVIANKIIPASNNCGNVFSSKIPPSSNQVIHCEANDTTGTSLLRIVSGA